MNTPVARTHAEATVTVRHRESSTFEESAPPALVELRIEESFSGDIEGESTVRALQIVRPDQSAQLLTMQRVRGRLGERAGTFVLQGEGVVERGRIDVSWFVVPDSGTGELAGLRGEGGFEGRFGEGSRATLDYWFSEQRPETGTRAADPR